MLNKNTLTLLLLCTSTLLFSQIGINTTAPNAQLDIRSSNQAVPSNKDGILIPKIDAFPATNPTSLQQGMMVYLTTLSGANAPGFYYWDNVSVTWKSVGSVSPGWNLTGNAGVDPATMFIGTTDSKNVVFKRANVLSGILGNYLTSYGVESYDGLAGVNTTAIGFRTLQHNSGTQNTAVGDISLMKNTTGNWNTAIGASSLSENVSGSANVAAGAATLTYNTTGSGNVAVGEYALFRNISASYNTAVGHSTLFNNTTGTYNTVLGAYSLNNNIGGSYNTALGTLSLSSNIGGSQNTAVGYSSSYYNTTGIENTAVGRNALYTNATGNGNTVLGTDAMKLAVAGDNNTAIGKGAYVAAGTFSNSTAIGYNAEITGSNQVRIGDANITYAGTQVAWSVTSDKRWKSNIKNTNLGLNFISKLRPVSYYRNNDESKKTEYGFIAQELDQTLQDLGAANNGIISKDDKGMYSVRYNDLLSPMVKAIQELETKNKTLELQNKKLEERLRAIEEKLSK